MNAAELAEAIENNKRIYDEYFDVPFGKALNTHVVDPLASIYFRAEFVGFEEFPERNDPEKPLIFASNHSGMAFPWDAIIFVSGLHKLADYGSEAPRALIAPMLSQSTLMNPFLIPNLWKRCGGIDATTLNFETMMVQKDHNLLIYPEGVPGIAKGFSRKYQLQKLSTSALRMSVKHRADIVPVATVNAEYINPWHYFSGVLNKLVNLIGVPFLPVGPLLPFLILQPWLFYYACPAKLVFVRGKRIKPYLRTNKPYEEMTQQDFGQLRDELHAEMQAGLDQAVATYGQRPYEWRSFFKKIWQNRSFLPFTFPFAWPFLFAEFERRLKQQGPDKMSMRLGFLSTIRIVLRNPFILTYFIPILGWIPIFIKGYRHKDTS